MNSNFYKIEKEIHIDEIMEKNPYKLIVLIFSFEHPAFNKEVLNHTFKLKKFIKNNLNKDADTIYLYINLQKYILRENKYSQHITKDSLPYISFYFNSNHLARILNCENDVFMETLQKIKEQLKEHFKMAKEKELNTGDNVNNETNADTQEKTEDHENLKEQIRQQRKLEEIEKLKQQYLINELTKLKKAKEIQEKLEENK